MNGHIPAKKVDYISPLLDPELCDKVQILSKNYDEHQTKADFSTWHIAKLVNDFWCEHQGVFDTKLDYFAECSRRANEALKKKRFSDSGQTLRRWCEVQETYAEFSEAERFLAALSFEHMRLAKKLASDGKVSVPVYALAKAVDMEYTADEMREYFDPAEVVHEYDKGIGYLDSLQAMKWDWLKKDERERVQSLLAELRQILEKVK